MSSAAKKFISRLLIFLSPFLLAIVIELFVLPVDFFTFRFYETIRVGYFYSWLNGPFYANMHLEKTERGDLGYRSPFSVSRKIITETDQFGFRKKNTDRHVDVVIIGDSFIWGGNLSQNEMLSEVLEKKLNKTVYPYAQADVNKFITDARFIKSPPETVIFASIERSLLDLPLLNEVLVNEMPAGRDQKGMQTLAMYCDRVMDSRMYNFFKSRFAQLIQKPSPPRVDSILFLKGAAANKKVPLDEIRNCAAVIESYKNYFSRKNIRFVFLPVPNKETIYYRSFPSQIKPNLLPVLIAELKKRHVPVIDTQAAFETAYETGGTRLYHLDDTHWNSNGVNLTASVISDSLYKN